MPNVSRHPTGIVALPVNSRGKLLHNRKDARCKPSRSGSRTRPQPTPASVGSSASEGHRAGSGPRSSPAHVRDGGTDRPKGLGVSGRDADSLFPTRLGEDRRAAWIIDDAKGDRAHAVRELGYYALSRCSRVMATTSSIAHLKEELSLHDAPGLLWLRLRGPGKEFTYRKNSLNHVLLAVKAAHFEGHKVIIDGNVRNESFQHQQLVDLAHYAQFHRANVCWCNFMPAEYVGEHG